MTEDKAIPLIFIIVVCAVVVGLSFIRDRGRCTKMGPAVTHTYFFGKWEIDSATYATCEQWERP